MGGRGLENGRGFACALATEAFRACLEEGEEEGGMDTHQPIVQGRTALTIVR